MLSSNVGKALLVASAAAGIGFLSGTVPSQAASPEYCAGYARDAAIDHVPQRGPVGDLIAFPFEVTGALLVGRTSNDFAWKRAYDQAYAECINSGSVTVVATAAPRRVVVARGTTGSASWLSYCASRYQSFDPATGTYTTYDGRQVPCR